MTAHDLGTFGVYLSAVIATVTVVGFALLARFWRSTGGWHVFWYMLVIAVVLDMSSIAHLAPDHVWFDWLRFSTFSIGMPIVLAWRGWIIFDLQLRRRGQAKEAYREGDSQRPADRTNP